MTRWPPFAGCEGHVRAEGQASSRPVARTYALYRRPTAAEASVDLLPSASILSTAARGQRPGGKELPADRGAASRSTGNPFTH